MCYRAGGAGAGKGVENNIVRIGRDMNNPMNKPLWLRCFKWLNTCKKFVKVVSLRLLISSNIIC